MARKAKAELTGAEQGSLNELAQHAYEAGARVDDDGNIVIPAADDEDGAEEDGDETVSEIVRVAAIVKQARFNPDKLIGEVGDFLLSDLRASRDLKPWAQLTEAEQRALIDRAHNQAREIVRRVIQAVAAKGFAKIDAQMEGGSWKEGEITAKIKARLTAENIEALSTGSPFVQVVFATAEAFEAPMQAKAEPNQKTFIDPETGEVITRPRGAPAGDAPGPDDEGGEFGDDEDPVFDQTDAGRQARSGGAP